MPTIRLSRPQIELYILNKLKEGYSLSYQDNVRVLTKGKEKIFVSMTRNGWCKIT